LDHSKRTENVVVVVVVVVVLVLVVNPLVP